MYGKTANVLPAHLHFCQSQNSIKKCKRAGKPTHQDNRPNGTEKKGMHITRYCRNGG